MKIPQPPPSSSSSSSPTRRKTSPTTCCSKVGIKRGPWTPEEDEILANYVRREGEGGWRTMPKRAGLQRCGKSCRLRWMNYLRPSVKRGDIAPDEEDLILRLHRLLGNRWALIAGRIPGRTDNEIKNYWNTHLSKKLIKQGIDPRTHRPLITYPTSPSSKNDHDQVVREPVSKTPPNPTADHNISPVHAAIDPQNILGCSYQTITNHDQYNLAAQSCSRSELHNQNMFVEISGTSTNGKNNIMMMSSEDQENASLSSFVNYLINDQDGFGSQHLMECNLFSPMSYSSQYLALSSSMNSFSNALWEADQPTSYTLLDTSENTNVNNKGLSSI